MIHERVIGRIQSAYFATKTVSGAARMAKVTRATAEKYISLGSNPRKQYQRAPSERVEARLRIIRRLASQTVRKGGRVWPKYGSAAQITRALQSNHGIQVSRRQAHRDLLRCGLKSFVRPAVPTRRVKDRDKRRAFARRELRNDWRRLVFTDESWLTCNECTGRRQWAKTRSQVHPRERRARWNVASVMVWAAFGHDYRSELVVFPSKMGSKNRFASIPSDIFVVA